MGKGLSYGMGKRLEGVERRARMAFVKRFKNVSRRGVSLSLSLCPSHIASITAKMISKSNVLSLENFSGKYILDNEWIIIFQFE